MAETRIEKKYAAASAQADAAEAESLPAVEKSVLACAMLDPKCAALLAVKGVRMDWFHNTRCRELCVRILEAHVSGTPTDAASMAISLQEGGKAWGPKFVDELCALEVLPAHAEYYVSRLAEAHFRSRVFDAADEAQKALDAREEASEVSAARLSERLAELQRWKARESEKTLSDIRGDRVAQFHQASEDRAAGRPVRTKGLSWGIVPLDILTDGIFPGLNIIAARPSFGKSMLENWIACHHLAQGRSVARACLDMTPRALADRGLTLLSGESLSKCINGFMQPSDESKLRAAAEATKGWREHIITEGTAEEIVSKARAIKAAEGLDLLTVDYIQLVRLVDEAKYMNDNMVISRATRILKEFAIQTDTPVVLLSQLSRAVEKEDREPQLSDLRDSGSIEQEARTVCFIYPEPAVVRSWMTKAGVSDWKALPIRPGVINCLKQQEGRTGCVGIRQFPKWGIFEAARFLSRDERAAHDAERERARIASDIKHRRVAAQVSDSIARGYDFGAASESCLYVVAKSPKGAYEVFDARFFPQLCDAARAIGEAPWVKLEEVVGLVPALARRSAIRREHGFASLADDAEILDASATAAAAAPSGPTRAKTDPDSPFYEPGNPDPDEEVAP